MQDDELRRSRRDYESLFESAPIGYFVLNKEGTILDVNHYGANLLQADRKSLHHKPFIVFVPRENHEQFFSHLQRVFDETRLQSHEMPVVDRRGRRLWGRFESRLQVTEEGIPRCFMTVIDVTERKRVEDDLILAREDAVQASRAKSLFLANMSHEIRTPMNGVLAMAELTLESELSEEQYEWVSIIRDSARELTRIIDDVLDFSRIDANKLKMETAPFDLDELLNSATGVFTQHAVEKQIEFRVERSDALHRWYHGDRYRLRQVIHNLLSNALKFTEQGEVVFCVRAQPISEFLHELTFEVRDTGIGIPESMRESVFESFQQGDISYSKSYQGTGLGLSISRRLARLMSGQLYFTSSEGEGSVFYFTVPLHVETQTGGSLAHDASPPSTAEERPLRVLVAEDNTINVLVIRTVLERAGYDATTASTGNEVLELLRQERFDLVLMDISMPEVDGIEATRRIRSGGAGEGNAHVPIIAITAHSMHGNREQFLEAGMDGYLSKPFSRSAMLDTVNRLLPRSRDEPPQSCYTGEQEWLKKTYRNGR